MAKYIASFIGLSMLVVLQFFQACKFDDNVIKGELAARDVNLSVNYAGDGSYAGSGPATFAKGEMVTFKFRLAETLPVQTIVDWYIVPGSSNLQADPNDVLAVSAGSITIKANDPYAQLTIPIKDVNFSNQNNSYSLEIHRLSGFVNMEENTIEFFLSN